MDSAACEICKSEFSWDDDPIVACDGKGCGVRPAPGVVVWWCGGVVVVVVVWWCCRICLHVCAAVSVYVCAGCLVEGRALGGEGVVWGDSR